MRTRQIYTAYIHRCFALRIHTAASHRCFAPMFRTAASLSRIRTAYSHRLFAPLIRTACSHAAASHRIFACRCRPLPHRRCCQHRTAALAACIASLLPASHCCRRPRSCYIPPISDMCNASDNTCTVRGGHVYTPRRSVTRTLLRDHMAQGHKRCGEIGVRFTEGPRLVRHSWPNYGPHPMEGQGVCFPQPTGPTARARALHSHSVAVRAAMGTPAASPADAMSAAPTRSEVRA